MIRQKTQNKRVNHAELGFSVPLVLCPSLTLFAAFSTVVVHVEPPEIR
jgi:hypothetical protein